MAPHYLRPGKSDGQPHCMIAVGYSLLRRSCGEGKTGRNWYDLGGAVLRKLTRKGDDWEVQGDVHVLSAIEFLASLSYMLEPAHTTWVWATHMHRLLSCIGFYRALEDGVYTIGGRDHGREVEAAAGDTREFRGYLHTSERSFTCLAQHRATGRVALLCDTRNFDSLIGECDGGNESRATATAGFASGLAMLVRREHLGPLRTTAAVQAIAGFRARFIAGPLFCHQQPAVASLERRAYWPGRCECFRVGRVYGPIYHLDITSAYPAACLATTMPTKLARFWRTNAPSASALLAQGWHVIVDVRLRDSTRRFPTLHAGKTCWPIGLFNTTLCGPELALAVESGCIVEQGATAIYHGFPALDGWARYWLALRDRPDIAARPDLRGAVKCITNRLFGCFARRTRQWQRCTCRYPKTAFDAWYQAVPSENHVCGQLHLEIDDGEPWSVRDRLPVTQWRSIAWNTEYMTAPEDNADDMVAISAWVSSLARCKLLEILCHAGYENTIYCDTDSVFVTDAGYERLRKSGISMAPMAGSLRLVAVHADMYVRAAKNYRVGPVHVHAGSPVCAVFDGEDTFQWDECESIYSAMRRSKTPCGDMVARTRHVPERTVPGTIEQDGRVFPPYLGLD